MKNNTRYYIVLFVVFGVCLSGAYFYSRTIERPTSTNILPITQETTPTNYSFTYLTSNFETLAYCDGAKMDSVGYRASITVPHTGTISKPNPSTTEIIRATVDASTTGMCHTAMNQITYTEKDGVVSISPIDAWAGFSITMCSCQPQVEVNILQTPGMKKVVWLTN